MALVIKLIHCASAVLELISAVTLMCLFLLCLGSVSERLSHPGGLHAEQRASVLLLMPFLIRDDTLVFRFLFFPNFNF